jgi:hypothetical protein
MHQKTHLDGKFLRNKLDRQIKKGYFKHMTKTKPTQHYFVIPVDSDGLHPRPWDTFPDQEITTWTAWCKIDAIEQFRAHYPGINATWFAVLKCDEGDFYEVKDKVTTTIEHRGEATVEVEEV